MKSPAKSIALTHASMTVKSDTSLYSSSNITEAISQTEDPYRKLSIAISYLNQSNINENIEIYKKESWKIMELMHEAFKEDNHIPWLRYFDISNSKGGLNDPDLFKESMNELIGTLLHK